MTIIANGDIFGRNLRYLRLKRGLTVEEMADLLHTDPIEIELLEAGEILEIEHDSLHLLYANFEENLDRVFYDLLETT